MIYFENWNIRHDGALFARQYDNLSRRLDVIGNLPEGWNWEMLVQTQDAFDIIPLPAIEGGVGTVLSEQQLSLSGFYTLQLRGRKDSAIKHTNMLQVFVSESLSGTAQWPEIPSSFRDMEQRITAIGTHPPKLDSDGFWMVWDPTVSAYKKTTTELTADIIKPEAAECWKLLSDRSLTESTTTILETFTETPMRKLLILFETPAAAQSTPATTITVYSGEILTGIGNAATIVANPKSVPIAKAASSVYEFEVVRSHNNTAYVNVRFSYTDSPYTRTAENSAGNVYTSYSLSSSIVQSAMWQPWDSHARTIKNQLTAFRIFTSVGFPVGTRLKIWGVEK